MLFLRSPYNQRIQMMGLLLLLWSLYGRTLFFDFVLLDDPTLVLENQILQTCTLNHIQTILNPFYFRKQLGTEYLPLRDFSYLIDFYFWGKNPFGYHLTNLIFFSLAIVFLFLFLRQFPPTKSVAFLATCLFILHPIHVESVVWISARKDVMALCFFMLSLWRFPALESPHFKRNLFCSWIFFLGALLSKMTTVILPTILWLLWPASLWPKKIYLLPHFLLAGGFAILSIQIGQDSGTLRWEGSLMETLAVLPVLLLSGFLQLLFPVALNCYYELLPLTQYPLFYISGGICCSGILLSIWFLAPNYRFSLLWFLWTFLPVSHLIPIPFFKADRYLLLPSLGFCLGGALLWQKYLQRSRQLALFGLGVVFFCWFLLAWNYSSAWKNSIALGSYASSQSQNLVIPKLILADAYLQEKQFEKASQVYEGLVQKSPGLWKAWFNLSRTYHFQNERTKEQNALQQAYNLTKILPETVAQHGLTHYRKDGSPESDVPIGIYIGSLLAFLLSEQDNFFQAREIAHEIYKKVPFWSQAPYLLGVIYAREGIRTSNAGRLTNADGFLQKALKLDPTFAEAHAKVCEVYWQRGEYSKSKEHFRQAYQIYLEYHQIEEAQALLDWIQQFK
ncbi:MAG: hypothetical protein AABZ60_10925 [Planctomycetota bacterium]